MGVTGQTITSEISEKEKASPKGVFVERCGDRFTGHAGRYPQMRM